MADQISPVSYDALMADRQAFWASFTSATTLAAAGVAAIVVALFIFVF